MAILFWYFTGKKCKTMNVNDVADIKTALTDRAIKCWVKTGNEIFEVEQMVMETV